MSDLKWLACQGVELNPYNLSVPERLSNFGYALVFDEFGNGKIDKAQLCIHNALSASEIRRGNNPNILIICPESLMQNWYSCLLSEIGADFKFISSADNTVLFYSKHISNLFIISEEQLKSPESKAVAGDPGIVWDLMIIDSGLSIDGADWAGYYRHCRNKAREVLVFAPCPFPYDLDISAALPTLKEMLKSFLHDASKKEAVSNLKIDENIVVFDRTNPAMRYYCSGKTGGNGPNVVTLEYKVDKKMFNTGSRITDIQTGLPFYTCGGNIFEEYNTELKPVYQRHDYDKEDIKALRGADNKLDVFLNKLDKVLKNGDNNVVVYFTVKETLNYISKVISTVYPELRDNDRVLIRTDSVLDSRFLKRRFSGEDADNARITLATDLIGEHYHGMGKVTHVFNYEYPVNPTELERRFLSTARVRDGFTAPTEFIIFSDKEAAFDGRILGKVMMGGLYRCFKKRIPSQSVLLWVENAEKYIVETLCDLKITAENAGDTGADYARNFCVKYNVADRGLVSTAAKAGKYAEQLLSRLTLLLDLEGVIPETGTPINDKIKRAMVKSVKWSIENIRSGYIYYDDGMRPCIIKDTNDYEKLEAEYKDNHFVKGFEAACKELESMLAKANTAKHEYPSVRKALDGLPDEMKIPVLYNIWKYCKLNKGYTQSLREFTQSYNEGVI